MNDKFIDGIHISDEITIIVSLLFADDLLLLADTFIKFQRRLNALRDHSIK